MKLVCTCLEVLSIQVLTTDSDSACGCCLLITCINVLHIDYVAGFFFSSQDNSVGLELLLRSVSNYHETKLSCTGCACIAACIAGSQ